VSVPALNQGSLLLDNSHRKFFDTQNAKFDQVLQQFAAITMKLDQEK
jgi:hypothetical protein